MSITKTLTDTGTDVPMDHHVVSSAAVQWDNDQVYVIVRSFYSKASYEAGRRALAETPVMLKGVPPRNAELLDWVQAQLILPVDTTLSLNSYINRWQFSGGSIIDHAPQPDVATGDATTSTSSEPAAALLQYPTSTAEVDASASSSEPVVSDSGVSAPA